MISYVMFVFSILVYVTEAGEVAKAAYNPTDVFLINCGSTSETIDTGGRTWTPEQPKFMELNLENTSFFSDASHQDSGVPMVPYMTARIFRSNFTYSFAVSPGWKFLRLYFYPTLIHLYLGITCCPSNFTCSLSNTDFYAFKSFFSVTVNGFTLLRNFSGVNTYEPLEKYVIKEFVIPVKHTIHLTFMPCRHSSAFVNGLEIVSMPDRFYSKGGFDDYVREVGTVFSFEINNATALETVYRLNVGGRMIDDVEDTGMFRRWLSDDYLVSENSGIVPVVPGVKINYTEETPAYVAPEDVYVTSRSMGNGNNPIINLNFNSTWLLAVDAGFNYLVRLHFCETLAEVNGPGERVFTIFIENQVAEAKIDVIGLSGGSRNPMYLDFNTFVASNNINGERRDLRLELRPYIYDSPKYFDGILNGIEILKLNDSEGSLARPNLNSETLRDKSHVVVIILKSVGSAIGLVTIVVVLMLLMRHIKGKRNRQNNSVAIFKVLLKHYTYAEVKKITKSFSHKIGKGGFGTVYGGNLCDGRKVAIKILKDTKGNGEDFINEVASMSQTSHVNIVSLLGFCYEGSKRAIIYEFLENGSLDQFISRKKSLTMDVTTLYGITLGIARGLEYLHYGCKTRIVHFDIKPQNILLDGNLCPKVSDFGLAKLCEKRESIVSLMDARGTIGYIAPEVFSRIFGMLVLEMMGARNKEIVETTASDASSAYFPDWVYKDLENGEQTWIFGDEITREEREIAKKMILVSLWCIQPCPVDRPPMNRVVEMIEGSLDALETPPKPSMQISRGLVPDQSSSLPSFSHAEEVPEKASNL
ncbi:hypothetical protein Bca52824_034778 [Brassica carinata]|uniref:Protein kinase domain-containing protein n=1 Tax=Brassica carinata TaxID=52824 RepID=A0A8X7V236_BRACI|nr:hypothetical protein Bca52824_034778 [Brassica carinata]